MKKATVIILVAIVFIGLAAAGLYKFNFTASDIQRGCTLEAKICPDGSTVGRTGPNCEFEACPQVEGKMTQTQARVIAQGQCIKGGEVLGEGSYNESTKTWWFEANLNTVRAGCNPACVVSEETKTAEINWRCTGLNNSSNLKAQENIKINFLGKNTIIKSPLKITGEARGWYFEGSFPIKLADEKGNILAVAIATATEDWMVDEFVPFEAELIFDAGGRKRGEIIFEKDNPSGLPELDQSLRLPILFE